MGGTKGTRCIYRQCPQSRYVSSYVRNISHIEVKDRTEELVRMRDVNVKAPIFVSKTHLTLSIFDKKHIKNPVIDLNNKFLTKNTFLCEKSVFNCKIVVLTLRLHSSLALTPR